METKNNPKLQSVLIPRNIIIESNNSTSKRSEISHISNKDKDENVKQKPNNSSWNTVLSNTIELDIGDEVSISSASINQIGSGENNIEFLGNITDSELVDNKMRVNMSSYVSNELKFNLPLPLSTTVFTENNENFLSTYQPAYMNIDLSNLANFLAAYPSNNLENLEFIAGKLYKPNGEKLYLGKRDWSGLYKDEYSLTPATGFPEIKLESDYGVHTNSIDINLNVGLESPENIAQNMTDSFHKPLVVNSSNTNKYINPVSIIQADIIDRDSIVVRNRKLFQENSYIAVSNTTSRGLYLEKDRGVKNDFLFDGSLAYDVTIFNKLFFENMLSGDPDRTYCMKKFQDLRKSDSFPDVQYHGTPSEDPVFYSGPNDAFDYFKTAYNTGNIGNIGHNIVVADRLNVNTDRSFIKYNYNLEVELQTQKLEESDVIMTNLLNTEENILLLKDVLHKIEYPVQDSSYPADVVDFSNKLFTNTLVSDLSFAMTDESLTDYNKAFENNLECYGRLIPHTRSRKEPTVDIVTTLTLPNSYLLNQPRENIRNDYNANYDLRYLISDDYLLQESFSSLNNSTAGRNKDWGYNVGIHSRFDSERVNNLPTASLFELNDDNKDLFETHDVGLVSANRKELLPNLSNDKQVSYIVDIGVASNNSNINGRIFQDAPLPANNVVAGNYILIQNNSTQNVQGQFTIYLSDTTNESGTYSIIGLDSYLLNDNGPKITDKNYIKQVLYCDPKYVGHFVRIDFLFNSRLPLRLKINTGTNTIFDQNIGPSFLYKYSLPNRIFYLGTNEDISLSNELSLTFNLLPFKKYQFMLLDNSYTGIFDQGVFDEDGNLIHLIETSVRDAGRTIFVRMRADDLSTSIMYLHMRVGGVGVMKRLKLIIPLVTSDIYRYEQASLKEKSFLGFTVKKKFNIDIPKTSLFESFGVSCSLNDNQLAFPLSIQKQTFSTATNGTTFYDPSIVSTAYETALMIGSNKLAVDYNETSRRFLFNYLHQPKTTGQDILFNFNSCKELTGTNPIPEFSATPAQEILSIYQEENVFAEDNVDNRNILFGLGIQAPKASKWSTGPVNVKTKDFNIWYESDDLSRTLSFNTSDGASDDVKTLTYDNGSAISLERFDLYPEFPSGTVNSDGVNNYGFPVNNTSSNRFPFIIRLEASNDNVQYDMFKANESDLQIPSKKVLVKPLVNQDYTLTGSNNQVKFKLDPVSIPFFIANRTMLKMNVKMLGDVPNYRPCASAGAQSLIRNLRVTSNGQELENVQELNSLVAMKYARNKTDSLDSKRTLFEGQSRTTDNSQSLYCEAPDDLIVAGITANKDNYRLITVELPLEAGLFDRDEVHCNALMPLDLTFNLENVKRACESISKVGATVGTLATALVSGTATTTIDVATTFQNNVFVGDSITVTEGANTKTFGPITKIAADASPTTKMVLTVTSLDPAFSYTTAAVITIDAASTTHRQVGVDVKLSDISLVVTTVQPPMEYVRAVQSAVGSATGLNIPVKTFELQRVNLTSATGLQTINIPNQSYSKVLSTFSVPMDVTTLQDLETDSLKGIYDDLQNYQYIYGDQAVPNREVPTQQYAGEKSRPAAIHQHELKKALDNSHILCLDLHRIPATGFMVARAWSDRGSVSDLSRMPLSLNLDYASTATKNKIIYNFINTIRIMTVTSQGIVRT